MRDKIFQASEGIAVTDSSAITQAREQGSSVHIGWGTTILIILFMIGIAVVGTQIVKKKDEKGGVAAGGNPTK